MELRRKVTCLLFSAGFILFLNQGCFAQNKMLSLLSGSAPEYIAKSCSSEVRSTQNSGNSDLIMHSFRSEQDNLPGAKGYYMKKGKNQNTAAWVLLIGGSVLFLGGMAAFDSNYDSGSNSSVDAAGFVLLTGLVADIASIPFFISASHNKKRAATLSFGNQIISPGLNGSVCRNVQPVLVFSVKF